MQTEKLTTPKLHVAATGFLSLFSLVGIMFYGLPFFYDFWVKDFGWTRGQVTSGNAFGKIIVGPLDRKSTRLNSSHERLSRMPSSA